MVGVVYQVFPVLSVQPPVGQIGRRLTQWSKKHRHAVELGDSANSALATWSAHHAVDWDSTKMLGHQRNYIKEKCWNLYTSEPKLGHFIETVDQCRRCTTRCFMLRSPTDCRPYLIYNYSIIYMRACGLPLSLASCVHCHC